MNFGESGGGGRWYGIFEGECFQEFDEVVDFAGGEVAGFSVLVCGIFCGEDIVQCGGAAVMEVGGAAIDAEQCGRVVAWSHQFCGIGCASADVMQCEFVGGCWLGV